MAREVAASVREAIVAGSQTLKLELKADMQSMCKEILAESHTYTDIMTQDLRGRIEGQFDTIDNEFQAGTSSKLETRIAVPGRELWNRPEQGILHVLNKNKRASWLRPWPGGVWASQLKVLFSCFQKKKNKHRIYIHRESTVLSGA